MKKDPNTVSSFEDASSARWLARVLEPARTRVQAEPSDDAVARMRLRVLGEDAPRRRQRTLAA